MKTDKLRIIAAGLLLTLLLSGCGAMSGIATSAKTFDAAATEMASYSSGNGWYDEAAVPMEEAAYEYSVTEEGGTLAADTESLSKENLKLIYTADIDIQATDFTATYNAVAALVDQYEGYFESSSVNNDGYYGDGSYMYGYYTVRVPAENYAAFVNAVGSSGYVTSLRENVKDIGLEYYETENRLETLRIKQQRLNELLAQAADMADIIELESALSDCEYNIDLYTSQLNRYDSLVGYSTVNLSIEKVQVVDPVINREYTFAEKMQRSFNNGVDRFIDGFQDFVLWVIRNTLNILFWAVVLLILWLIHPISRLREGGRKHLEKRNARRERKAAKKAGSECDAAKRAGRGGKYVKDEGAAAAANEPAAEEEPIDDQNV